MAADDCVVPAVQNVSDWLPKQKHTVQIYLELRFAPLDGVNKQASSVRDALHEVSATDRKFRFAQQTEQTSAPKDEEFTLVQVSATNSLIGPALCPKCCQETVSAAWDKIGHGNKTGAFLCFLWPYSFSLLIQ